jgi:hypothetical protein
MPFCCAFQRNTTDAGPAPMHVGPVTIGPADGGTGLVVVMNHVLADGPTVPAPAGG